MSVFAFNAIPRDNPNQIRVNPRPVCSRYTLGYLLVAAIIAQVWVVVSASANLPSVIITTIISVGAFVFVILKARQMIFAPQPPPDQTAHDIEEEVYRRVIARTLHSNSLLKQIVDRLKVYKYLRNVADQPTAEDALPPACTICLDDYIEENDILLLPCHHHYHDGCIRQWFLSHRICPICKVEVTLTSVLSPAYTERSEFADRRSIMNMETFLEAGLPPPASPAQSVEYSHAEQYCEIGMDQADVKD